MTKERKLCRGKADPSAPHDLTLSGALLNDGACRRCRQYTDRKMEERRKAKRAEGVRQRAFERTQRCGGKQDPTAPHDLTLPGALTKKGRCAECHRFSIRRSQRRARAEVKALAEDTLNRLEQEAVGSPVSDDELGVPVYPKGLPNSRETGFWAAQNRFRSLSLEEADFAGALLDEWPEECVEMSQKEERVEGETDFEFQTFRRAMVSLSQRKDLTPYARALAWKALADTRGD